MNKVGSWALFNLNAPMTKQQKGTLKPYWVARAENYGAVLIRIRQLMATATGSRASD